MPHDRAKHLALKLHEPHWKIKFIFTNPKAKLYKGGKMTNGGWCEKHGFKYCHIDKIPKSWWKEVK